VCVWPLCACVHACDSAMGGGAAAGSCRQRPAVTSFSLGCSSLTITFVIWYFLTNTLVIWYLFT
jgi:hypothetical protein